MASPHQRLARAGEQVLMRRLMDQIGRQDHRVCAQQHPEHVERRRVRCQQRERAEPHQGRPRQHQRIGDGTRAVAEQSSGYPLGGDAHLDPSLRDPAMAGRRSVTRAVIYSTVAPEKRYFYL